jgi:DNA-binding MarR family transcriptional regulator
MEVLWTLRREPGLRVQDAATRLSIAANSASTLVKSLSDAGLLERRPDPEDGRGVRLFLSDQAERLLSQLRDERESAITDALSTLTDSERRAIEAALPALNQLVDTLLLPRLEPVARPVVEVR